MCESEKNAEIFHTDMQRFFAALICAAIILATFLSSLYIVCETEHDCTGVDCRICACIQQCEQHLKQLGTGKKSEETAAIVAFFAAAIIPAPFHAAFCTTLISQKVRLNN